MEIFVLIVFILGYLSIALEHPLKINKTATALVTGILCWTLFALDGEYKIEFVEEELAHHLSEIAQILFFLIGAMTIVELVDIHDGFTVITSRITTKNKVKLLWAICFLTFFLSAILDNLTTSIVMVSLLGKLIDSKQDRLWFASMIIIAANAGGAWSPIGDITTTMLWIEGQITTVAVVSNLILPSIISLAVPLIILSFTMKGDVKTPDLAHQREVITTTGERNFIFFLGVAGLVFVPIYKIMFHLPPYMGMMLSLGVLWIVTELMHKNKKNKFKSQLSASHALEKIDVPSVLFFLGILLAVSVLQSNGMLHELASWLDDKVGNDDIIVSMIGVLSAIVDNVPLVKGAQGMYDMAQYPVDSKLWEYLAYCAGTGGSILIFGSAAGVTVMGMENINFFWYFKRISLLALIGYIAGAAAYLLQYEIIH